MPGRRFGGTPAATGLLLALLATGCADEQSAAEPEPAPVSSSAPTEDPGPTPEVVAESATPDDCTFPALRQVEEPTFPLLHGEAERGAAPGVSFLLATATPGEEIATIELTRRVVGCVGTATVRVPAEETVTTLGMTLRVSRVTAAIDVPNRASVTVTVLDSGD